MHYLLSLLLSMQAYASVFWEPHTSLNSESRVIELSDVEEAKLELSKPGPRIVMYTADWCSICKSTLPYFHQASAVRSDIKFYVIHAENIRFNEHLDVIDMAWLYVARSNGQLHSNPCTDKGLNINRTSAGIKLFLMDCLGTLKDE